MTIKHESGLYMGKRILSDKEPIKITGYTTPYLLKYFDVSDVIRAKSPQELHKIIGDPPVMSVVLGTLYTSKEDKGEYDYLGKRRGVYTESWRLYSIKDNIYVFTRIFSAYETESNKNVFTLIMTGTRAANETIK